MVHQIRDDVRRVTIPAPTAMAIAAITVVMTAMAATAVQAQQKAQLNENAYVVADSAFGQLPDGRKWGSTSAVYPSPDGNSIWVADRCGANTCVGSNLTVIMQFDLQGKLLQQFGAGMFAWPHGMYVDREGNVWVTDAAGIGGTMPQGQGHVVYKFSPKGELLLTIGHKGMGGRTQDMLAQPSAVLVAPSGDIFVADGHGANGNNRIVKYNREGRYIREWGSTGEADGQFRDAHALAMDSQGRLFVADRGNNRIQIFDQEGKHIATWKQFGRPSGLFIDRNDVLYATDSESNTRRNPGWKRGIYIGSAKNGRVTMLIPDPEPNPDNSATSGAEGVAVDARGHIYGAEVGPHTVRRYVPRR